MITAPSRPAKQNLQIDGELAAVDRLFQAARTVGIRTDRQAVINVHISLKSRPFLLLTGEKESGKVEMVKCLGRVLTEIPAWQCQLFVGHARWASESQDIARFVEMQDRFNRNNLLALMEEARQKENANRLFIACLTRISPAELYDFFSLPGLQFWPDQARNGEDRAATPIPYPPNFRLLGTMDTTGFNGWTEDLLAQTTVVNWSGVKLQRQNQDNPISYLQSQKYVPAHIPPLPTAYARLKRILDGQRQAFLPLVQVLDLLHRHNISLPHEVIGRVIRYLANSWTKTGAGLFDPTPLRNLRQAFDLALAQYLLPWIVAAQPEPGCLLNCLSELFDGQFNQAAMFINTLQSSRPTQRTISQITYGAAGAFT